MLWRLTCMATAALCIALGFWMMLDPWSHLSFLGAPKEHGHRVMAARVAPFYGGFGLLMIFASFFHDRMIKRAISAVALVVFGGLALLGLWHWSQGEVGPLIWRALLVEAGFAGLFALHLIRL